MHEEYKTLEAAYGQLVRDNQTLKQQAETGAKAQAGFAKNLAGLQQALEDVNTKGLELEAALQSPPPAIDGSSIASLKNQVRAKVQKITELDLTDEELLDLVGWLRQDAQRLEPLQAVPLLVPVDTKLDMATYATAWQAFQNVVEIQTDRHMAVDDESENTDVVAELNAHMFGLWQVLIQTLEEEWDEAAVGQRLTALMTPSLQAKDVELQQQQAFIKTVHDWMWEAVSKVRAVGKAEKPQALNLCQQEIPALYYPPTTGHWDF